MLWPYDADGHLLPDLPPGAARWLAPARAALASRADARHSTPWWTLFRTEAADPRTPRVVWPDLARRPHPHLLPAGDRHVPLNTCYVARFTDPVHALDDARAFAALLRSPPVAAWLTALAEPARGGYRRFLAWTVALLPVPQDWPAARQQLAPLTATDTPDAHTRAVARRLQHPGPYPRSAAHLERCLPRRHEPPPARPPPSPTPRVHLPRPPRPPKHRRTHPARLGPPPAPTPHPRRTHHQ